MLLVIFALSIYFPCLTGALLVRSVRMRRGANKFSIAYARLPIAIALLLLAAAAGVLVSDNEDMVNDLAIMAYYFLVLGMCLQVINYYIREQRAQRRASKLQSANPTGEPPSDEQQSA